MADVNSQSGPVTAKAVLLDRAGTVVLWMNEAASQGDADALAGAFERVPVERAIPMAEMLGVPAAIREVASDGAARHLSVKLVSTGRGSVDVVVSIYRLPDANLLVLIDNAWEQGRGRSSDSGTTGSARRRR